MQYVLGKYYYPINKSQNHQSDTMMRFGSVLFLLVASLSYTSAFVTPQTANAQLQQQPSSSRLLAQDALFETELSVPPRGSGVVARLQFPSVFKEPSEIVEVRYSLPFGLNVEPQNNLAVCTKDGPGGEKVGDVLRYTSQWTMGMPRGDGLITTAASFSGSISWQCSMFDVLKAKDWNRVVEALTSNVEVRVSFTKVVCGVLSLGIIFFFATFKVSQIFQTTICLISHNINVPNPISNDRAAPMKLCSFLNDVPKLLNHS